MFDASWRAEHGRGCADAVHRRVRLVPPRIRGSVLVEEHYSRRISHTRGETKNADKPRTSHRTHPRDTHLRTRELDDHFCADHYVAGDAVYAGASAVDFGAALGCGGCYQLAVFRFCSFPRIGAQHGGTILQDSRRVDHFVRVWWCGADRSGTEQSDSGI